MVPGRQRLISERFFTESPRCQVDFSVAGVREYRFELNRRRPRKIESLNLPGREDAGIGRLSVEVHDFYKFLEAACATLAVTKDPELERVIEQSISAIGKAQRDDGYIHTPVLVRQRNGDTTLKPFQDRHNFEMYNMGHLVTAACVPLRRI